MTASTLPDFGQLYEQWQAPIFGFVQRKVRDRTVAEDLAGKAWLKAFEHFRQFDGANFRGWMYRIAENVVKDARRHESLIDVQPADEAWLAPRVATDLTPERHAVVNEAAAEALRLAGVVFESLSPAYRAVLWEYEYRRRTYDEIAALGWRQDSRAAVKSLLFRARVAFDAAVAREQALRATALRYPRWGQRQDTLTRLWCKVQRRGPGDCWGWTGGRAGGGGAAEFHAATGRIVKAQRVVYAATHGPIPGGIARVFHIGSRDPVCTNPTHLVLGKPAMVRAPETRIGNRGGSAPGGWTELSRDALMEAV